MTGILKTNIIFLLDESYSMDKYCNDTVRGCGELITKQIELHSGNVNLRMYYFSDSCRQVYMGDMTKFPGYADYRPQNGGRTSLYKSIIDTINENGS